MQTPPTHLSITEFGSLGISHNESAAAADELDSRRADSPRLPSHEPGVVRLIVPRRSAACPPASVIQ